MLTPKCMSMIDCHKLNNRANVENMVRWENATSSIMIRPDAIGMRSFCNNCQNVCVCVCLQRELDVRSFPKYGIVKFVQSFSRHYPVSSDPENTPLLFLHFHHRPCHHSAVLVSANICSIALQSWSLSPHSAPNINQSSPLKITLFVWMLE